MSIFLDNELGLEESNESDLKARASIPFLLNLKTIDINPIEIKRTGRIMLFEFSSTYKSANAENPEKIKLNK
jgi:hypothetical protein